MPELLVRVEAVNLGSFILDTQDISTVRGGGLLLLDMAADLEKELGSRYGLSKVFTAGSIGLFHAESGDAGRITEAIQLWIAGRPALKDATIQVQTTQVQGTETIGTNFVGIHTRVKSKVRWGQMQSPTVVYPTALEQDQICLYDRVRPASATVPDPVSAATKSRREYGRKQKMSFYRLEAHVPVDWNYTHDLDDLTGDHHQGNLHHKMALIYLDGNKFSKVVGSCKTKEELGRWSRILRANQASVLRHILEGLRGIVGDEKDLPVETLLWGGDEIIWAVPAWLGWWWMNEFYRNYGRLGEWPIDGKTVTTTDRYSDTHLLTHGAAIVFCHHNAPIQRVIGLAKGLADWPKEKGLANTFTYQVLESFDHLGEDAGQARLDRIPAGFGKDFYCLPGDRMGEIQEAVWKLKACVPKGELHALVQLLCREKDMPDAEKQAADVLVKSVKRDAKAKDHLSNLAEALGMETLAAWIHLLELWDYIVQPTTDATRRAR